MIRRIDSMSRENVQSVTERTIEREVTKIFENAGHFKSGDRFIQHLALERGWIYTYQGKWHTMRAQNVPDAGIRGPNFDTYGQLLEFLLNETAK